MMLSSSSSTLGPVSSVLYVALRPSCHRQVLSNIYLDKHRFFYSSCRSSIPKGRRKLITQPELANAVGGVELPPLNEWRSYFPVKSAWSRIAIRNPQTADKIANAFIDSDSRDKLVIESNPGPGQLTRSLLKLPRERIKKLIVLEPNEMFLKYLKPLEAIDDRVKVFPLDPYQWSTYQDIEGELEDVPKLDWNAGIHPKLHFVSHIPTSVVGEQLIAQFFRAIPDKQWLFKYGRVQMDLITSSRMWQRLTASPTEWRARCKVGVICQATGEITEPLPASDFEPFNDHFHPAIAGQVDYNNTSRYALEERRMGHPHQLMRVTPLEQQVIEPNQLEVWDYVVRRLFVQKATPVKNCIQALGPGAAVLGARLIDNSLPTKEQLNTNKAPRVLELEEWKLIVDAFERWPFRPDNLSIDNAFTDKRSKL